MRHQQVILLVVTVTAIMLVLPNIGNSNTSGTHPSEINLIDSNENVLSNGIPPPYMYIQYEENFTDYGWTGDGSEETPYTLDGAVISHSGGAAIAIWNTRSYFKISNCILSGDSSFQGIYLNNVTHGHIQDCDFKYFQTGVYILNSTDILVEKNHITESSYGIDSNDVVDYIIQHNTVSPVGYGIRTRYTCENLTIYNNSIAMHNGLNDYSHGIETRSSNTNITNNHIYAGNGVGIHLDTAADYCNVTHNRISNMSSYGIHAYQGDDHAIMFNNVTCTFGDGIRLTTSDSNTITNNQISISNKTGIYIDGSDLNNVSSNHVWYCQDYGIFSDATSSANILYDNSIGWNTQNAWDDAATTPNAWSYGTQGNHWANWTVTPHPIPGLAGNSDAFADLLSDPTAPSVSDEEDFAFFEGTTGNIVSWTFYDEYLVTYTLIVNDVEYTTNYTCCNYAEFNVDEAPVGEYNLTLVVTDAAGNNGSDQVIMTVEVVDTTPPVIAGMNNQTMEAYDDQVTLEWNATDAHPDKYIIYRNDTVQDSDDWESGVNITEWFAYRDPGAYNYTLWVNDTQGYSATHTVWVFVYDTTIPIYNFEADMEYEVGTSTSTLEWDVKETYPDIFIVYLNGSTVYASGEYTTTSGNSFYGNITIDVGGQGLGYWNFTVVAYDESGNFGVDTVILHVFDTVDPTCTSEDDIQFEDGMSPKFINFTCSDLDPYMWYLYKNKTQINSDDWDGNDLQFNVDDAGVGTWNYTLLIMDGSGNTASAIAWVVVLDTTDPTLNEPDDIVYESGTTGHTISWTPDDLNPDSYKIWKDETEYLEGAWNSSSETIVIDIDGLAVRDYNFTIKVWDTSGLWAVDEVNVSVEDTTAPQIEGPNDLSYTVGETDNEITWDCSDAHPSSYTVYQNGTVNKTASWDGSDIVLDIDGLAVGVYNFTLYLEDDYGQSATDTVIVTVEEESTTTTTTTTDTTTDTTTETTSETTTETDTSSTSTPPPDDGGTMLIMLAAGIGGAVVVIIVLVYFMKLKKK